MATLTFIKVTYSLSSSKQKKQSKNNIYNKTRKMRTAPFKFTTNTKHIKLQGDTRKMYVALFITHHYIQVNQIHLQFITTCLPLTTTAIHTQNSPKSKNRQPKNEKLTTSIKLASYRHQKPNTNTTNQCTMSYFMERRSTKKQR